MSTVFSCDDKATLVAYLYGEAEPAERDRVEAHLSTCAACAAEVRALGDVRLGLALWAPPDAELGFAIVKRSDEPAPATVLRPARWWSTVPAWAQAAAAVLVLAAGAAIANVQVRSDANGFVVSTGWMAPEPTAAGPTVATDDQAWRTALVSLEQQLRAEIRTSREQDVRAAVPASADDATLRRVRQMLAESEERQQQQLALRFVEFTRDVNIQRRADLVKITNSLGDFDERIFRQRQMMNNQQQFMNNVLRVNQTPQQ
jgi:hypothetical protein